MPHGAHPSCLTRQSESVETPRRTDSNHGKKSTTSQGLKVQRISNGRRRSVMEKQTPNFAVARFLVSFSELLVNKYDLMRDEGRVVILHEYLYLIKRWISNLSFDFIHRGYSIADCCLLICSADERYTLNADLSRSISRDRTNNTPTKTHLFGTHDEDLLRCKSVSVLLLSRTFVEENNE